MGLMDSLSKMRHPKEPVRQAPDRSGHSVPFTPTTGRWRAQNLRAPGVFEQSLRSAPVVSLGFIGFLVVAHSVQ